MLYSECNLPVYDRLAVFGQDVNTKTENIVRREGIGSENRVSFNIAFAPRPGGAAAVLEPVWLAVDSTFDEAQPEQRSIEDGTRHHAQTSLKDLSNHLKRELFPPCQQSAKKLKGSL